MDPCPFVRLSIYNLALKFPVETKPMRSFVHSSSPCFCIVKLKNFPSQTAPVPYIPPESNQFTDGDAVTFHLTKNDLDKLAEKSVFSGKLQLNISIYTGLSDTTCGINSGRLLGKLSIPLNLTTTKTTPKTFINDWVSVGREAKASFHLIVKAEPDPRFVFQFGSDPECSPEVFQIQGNIRQPVFTCKFSLRSIGDRHYRSRSFPESSTRGWLSLFGSDRERPTKERKGWSVTIHDLCGSPVALASIITPFVASPGSDQVTRSSPGSWLILRSVDGTWRPWGRLEAWREHGGSTPSLGCRFELISDLSASGLVLAESTLSCSKGGKFMIDLGTNNSPNPTPRGSGDFDYGLWPYGMHKGFVMSAKVEGENMSSKPMVEVSMQHVGCSEDAAAFVALSAAIDLSMDACKLFSRKLRNELLPPPNLTV